MFLQHAYISLYCALSATTFTDIKHKIYYGRAVSSLPKISLFSKNIKSMVNILEILDSYSCVFSKLIMELVTE